jgi:hypothetical protein
MHPLSIKKIVFMKIVLHRELKTPLDKIFSSLLVMWHSNLDPS